MTTEKRGNMPTKIYRRDGKLVKLEPERISDAMHKAFSAIEYDDSRILAGLTRKVTSELDLKYHTKIPHTEDALDIIEKVLMSEGHERAAKEFIDYRRQHAVMREAKKFFGVSDEMKLSVNAARVLEKRYLLKNDRGAVIETPRQLFRRVAREIARVETRYGSKEVDLLEEQFYRSMADLEFLPNSPTLMNAGTRMGQLSACFVLPVQDSVESIFETLKHMALIHQSGGGTGFSFSGLRPEGDIVSSTKCAASGPISFMKIYDKATDVIKQGGRRRGANMGVLRVDHPDIIPFVSAKKDGNQFLNFNFSVAVTDEFMKKAEKNQEYALMNPRTGIQFGKLNSRDTFRLIATMAWYCGDPGIIFIDEINRHNPTPSLGLIESTNPCVTADTWVMTDHGPRTVKELVGKKFVAVVNGEKYTSTDNGFFSTGVKPVLKICTAEGFDLRATENHQVLKLKVKTRYSLTTEWVPAGSLKKGDRVVLNDHRAFKGWKGRYGEKEGYLIGLLLGDGTIKKDKSVICSWGESKGAKEVRNLAYSYALSMPHRSDFQGWMKVKGRNEYRMVTAHLSRMARQFGLKPRGKLLNDLLEKESSSFCKGMLRGLFDSDGSVQGSQSKGVSVRLSQSNAVTLKRVQRSLLRFGILSTIYCRRDARMVRMPDGKGGGKYYVCRPDYELIISRDSLSVFSDRIGFGDFDKKIKLEIALKRYQRKPYKRLFTATINSIQKQKKETVFDAVIPDLHAFDANGFYVHNCGEQPLLPYESCNLGSINLGRFVREGAVDTRRLEKTVRLAVRFLDNVIDANRFPLEQIEEATKASRKIGLGVMGFADLLVRMKVPYDSEQAVKLASKIMKLVHDTARDESARLGVERGDFPLFKKSRLAGKWKNMRNASVTTVAPTGTISIIAGCSSGIEPLFGISFVRNVMSGAQLLETNTDFEELAKQKGFHSKELMRDIAHKGTVQEMKAVPSGVRRLFVTALDIKPEWHIRIQAAFQKHTDSAVSKTINFPADATIDDFEKAFKLAYKLKCKGITAYRYGSRQGQVLNFNDGGSGISYVSVDSEYSGGCPGSECPF